MSGNVKPWNPYNYVQSKPSKLPKYDTIIVLIFHRQFNAWCVPKSKLCDESVFPLSLY